MLASLKIDRLAPGSDLGEDPDDPARQVAILVRAGEIARQDGRRQDALGFYGRAIDSCLQAGLTRRAESLCRHVIDMEPRVIRTRYTLTAIAVGRDDLRNARKRLTEYMVAVGLSNAEPMAVPPLLELASSTAHPVIRDLIAEALRRAGRPDLAEGVEHGRAARAGRTDWSRAVGAALKRPGDVDMDALTDT
ncbi:MAG: hypothetical protein KY466_11805 [Gemmatimonadetes bacterium]|nr:hypothetical protein [Gemmatimonadota bacterium]